MPMLLQLDAMHRAYAEKTGRSSLDLDAHHRVVYVHPTDTRTSVAKRMWQNFKKQVLIVLHVTPDDDHEQHNEV